jgi:nitrate/TMAO reductase-like tetraheme cytochrome c subunit
MRPILLSGLTRVTSLVLLLSSAFVPGAQGANPAEPSKAASAYASASSCGACHADIFKAWQGSAHARSASSPAYLEARSRVSDPKGREGCVWCHAPTTLMIPDPDLQKPITREGITCDFCHTITAVHVDEQDRSFVTMPGPIKRGPFDYVDGKVEGHEAAYSALHRGSPLLCAACHEYTNARGVAVLSNYSEWKQSPYPARGVSCQDCHMALVPGTLAEGTKPRGGLRTVNLHRLVGGSAASQLARGLELSIDSVSGRSGSSAVAVSVTNVAAGHSIPGGLSTKTLVLAVAAESAQGKLESRQERTYRRELKDERGMVLQQVSDMFLRAASIGADTRLRPGEKRVERFTISLPQGARAIVARLEYRDASDPRGTPTTLLVIEKKRPL